MGDPLLCHSPAKKARPCDQLGPLNDNDPADADSQKSTDSSWKSHRVKSWKSHGSLRSSQDSFRTAQENGTASARKASLSDCSKEEHEPLKTVNIKFVCNIMITVDGSKSEVSRIAINQMKRLDACPPSSVSSGSLADHSSLSDGASVSSIGKFQLQARHSNGSTSSSSTTVSSAFGLNKKLGKTSDGFTIPQVPLKPLLNTSRPKICVCSCYCGMVFSANGFMDHINNSHEVPDKLSVPINSLDGTPSEVNEPQEVNAEVVSDVNGTPMEEKQSPLEEEQLSPEEEQSSPEDGQPPSFDAKTSFVPENISPMWGENLLVLAKWADGLYPGFLKNATMNDWNEQKELDVTFLDYVVKKMSTAKILPAHLILPGTKLGIVNHSSGDVVTGVLIKIVTTGVSKALSNSSKFHLFYTVALDNGTKTVTFERIMISNVAWKCLKKQGGANITPNNFTDPSSKVSLGNVQWGKRRQLKSDTSMTTPVTSSDDQPSTKRRRGKTELPPAESIQPPTSPETCDSTIRNMNKEIPVVKRVTENKKSLPPTAPVRSMRERKPLPSKAISKPTRQKKVKEPVPSTSTSTRRRHRQSLRSYLDLLSPDHEFELSSICVQNVQGSFIECEVIPPSNSNRKSIGGHRSKSSTKTPRMFEESEEVISLLGPMPISCVFKNFNFILTHSVRRPPFNISSSEKSTSDAHMASSSDENVPTDFEDYYSTDIPFDLLRLKKQIALGGGQIYESVADVPTNQYRTTLIVSDFPTRTPNYLLGVLLGLKITRHDAIINSCKLDRHIALELISAMMLPAGRSFEDNSWIIADRNRKPQCFKGLSFLLSLSCSVDTMNFWKGVISLQGGSVNVLLNEPFADDMVAEVNIIIADQESPEELIEAAKEFKIPVLSLAWLIESTMRGSTRQMNPQRFKAYSHDQCDLYLSRD